MKIYIAHASSHDFNKELYQPIQAHTLYQTHQIILPHLGEPIPSRQTLMNCDLVIAEVSYPSTGLGIELGWANDLKKPIACLHKTDVKPSSSLRFISQTILPYASEVELLLRLEQIVSTEIKARRT